MKVQPSDLSEDDPEVKVTASTIVNDSVVDVLLARFSTWRKLKTTVAWLLHAKENLKRRLRKKDVANSDTSLPKDLTADELDAAEIAIVKYIQKKHFPGHIEEAGTSIQKLDPFRDVNGILRVGGRLSRANIPLQTKHPILLPKGSVVSRLIVNHIHRSTGHLGSNTVLTRLRQKYWLPRGSVLIRSLISKCVLCRRHRGKLCTQKMADLPASHLLADEPPFSTTGVDYFGPFQVTLGRGRRIEDLHVTSSMTLPTVAAILEVFLLRRTGRFN
jgi:hypothetical protein